MTIMSKNMAPGRHGAVSEGGREEGSQKERDREICAWQEPLKSQNPPQVTHLLQQSHTIQKKTLLTGKQAHKHEPMEPFLSKPPQKPSFPYISNQLLC